MTPSAKLDSCVFTTNDLDGSKCLSKQAVENVGLRVLHAC